MGGSEITKIELTYVGKHWQTRKYLPLREDWQTSKYLPLREDGFISTLICTIYVRVKITKIGTNICFCHFYE
jgi:hypothetical protein